MPHSAEDARESNISYLETERLQLHGIGGCQSRQQPALVGEVLHDALALELRPGAGVAQGNGDAYLGRVNRTLCDQHAPCTHQTSKTFRRPQLSLHLDRTACQGYQSI